MKKFFIFSAFLFIASVSYAQTGKFLNQQEENLSGKHLVQQGDFQDNVQKKKLAEIIQKRNIALTSSETRMLQRIEKANKIVTNNQEKAFLQKEEAWQLYYSEKKQINQTSLDEIVEAI
ncbi:MAG: hypothetical protein PHE89_08180 [Alphaproteobacteria bacterium]|nr:hypothetical protein [Alphaproteobacteria bacterium]